MALEFLNKMSGSLASAGKDLGKVAKNAGEVMRLQNEIRANEAKIHKGWLAPSIEAKIQEHLLEIGKRYYATIKENPAEEYVYLVGCVRKLEERIADDQESLNNLRRIKVCPECGAQLAPDAVMCASCGTRVGG